MIRISNTLTDVKKDEFSPRQKGFVNLFVCGPTVYDYSHIGHAKTYIFFDVVAKYLRERDFEVYYLQNITDIDDRIIKRGKAEGRTPESVANEFTKEYLADMASLKIDSVTKYAKATDNIKEIQNQVKRLIDGEYAYATTSITSDSKDSVSNSANMDVYFDVSKFKEYGKLSKQNVSALEEGVRIDVEANKKNPRDFVLWKAQNYSYEPYWQSPWGMGRPGWHIEDTAISEKYLGQQYDLHGGAVDLIFPHHEAEIAQMEAISGKKPFVKYWMHTGFLTLNGEKMSKSVGNTVVIRDILKNHTPEAVRMMAIANYYRSPLDYKDNTLRQFNAAANRLAEFKEKLLLVSGDANPALDKFLADAEKKFFDSMDDDFNTPEAIAALFELLRSVNSLIAQNSMSKAQGQAVSDFLEKINSILGIIPEEREKIPKEILNLVDEREKARDEKDWKHADDIRNGIEQFGYSVEDTSYGPYIKKK